MINIEKVKPTGLFTNYIYKAIPLAFDESMSYYETLCGLLAYLKDTVIPALNNNADAIVEVQELMTQLQNYVNNYFDNLDVQEEINNKLDEMVEDGTLEEIMGDYLNTKAIFGFDNVISMKTATNLINGSFARTLGYSNKNDGNGGLYKIRTITNEDDVNEINIIALSDINLIAELIGNRNVVCFNTVNDMKENKVLTNGCYAKTLGYYNINDDGNALYYITNEIPTSYYETLNNGLYAKLIFNGEINVKQFGAYGDETHDDTTAIKNLIQFEKDLINDEGLAKNSNKNIVCFPTGKYLISETLTIPVFMKIRTKGYVGIILTTETTAIHFTPSTGDITSSEIASNEDYINGDLIDGDGLTLTTNMDTKKGVGIELGTRTLLNTSYQISKYNLENVHIQNFNIGVLFNPYHNYCGSINKCNVIKNNINLQFGSGEDNKTDSGEKMNIRNCVLSDADIIVKFMTISWELNFINCSLDYSKVGVLLDDKYHTITFNQCHFEGLGNNSNNDYYGLVYGSMGTSDPLHGMISIIQSHISLTNKKKLFNCTNGFYYLTIENTVIRGALHNYDGENAFMIDNNVRVTSFKNNLLEYLSVHIPQRNLNILKEDSFASVTTGTVDASSTNKIGIWDIGSNHANVDISRLIISENSPIGEKSLIASTDDITQTSSIELKSDYIPFDGNTKIIFNAIAKNISGYNPHIIFYDENKQQLLADTAGMWCPDNSESIDHWYVSPALKISYAPRNTKFVKLHIRFNFVANKTGEIGGIFLQNI